jgi:hypothetical protein
MPEIVGTVLASSLTGRVVFDRSGRELGKIADVEVEPDDAGRLRVTWVIVAASPWGRLLGYERPEATTPVLLHALARAVMRRDVHRVEWEDLDLSR